jgi:hypothetical protein
MSAEVRTKVRVPLGEFVPSRALNPAELRLLPYLAEGLEGKEIALACRLSPDRVYKTIAAIAGTLPGCGKTQLKAMRYAVMWWAENEMARGDVSGRLAA